MSARGLGPDHAYDDYMLDLEAVVERLGLERFVLFGGLLSGHTAIRYAAHNPGRVAGLILQGIGPRTPPGGVRLGEYMEETARRSWEDALREFVPRNTRIGDEQGDAASLEYFRETINQEDFLRMMRTTRTSNVEDVLGGVTCPTLIVTGKMYTSESQEGSRRLAAAIPNSRLAFLEQERFMSDIYTNDGSIPPIVPLIDEFVAGIEGGTGPVESDSGHDALSAREREVLRLIAAGRSNPQIADELVISLNTVRRHVSNILDKTGAANRTEAAVYARDKGLV
jgi:DNA-binding CsgD family transcriptional regulator